MLRHNNSAEIKKLPSFANFGANPKLRCFKVQWSCKKAQRNLPKSADAASGNNCEKETGKVVISEMVRNATGRRMTDRIKPVDLDRTGLCGF